MKHYLHNSLRALFLSLAVLLSLPMLAADTLVKNGISYQLDKTTWQATVIAKSSGKYTGSIRIPEIVSNMGKDYTVTSIGNGAFQNCSDLTSVTIPNTVTSIEDGAFYGCSGLSSVYIPNSVKSIGAYAFTNCSGLTSVTISNSVTSIKIGAFRGCSGLTSVAIPNSVTSIDNDAFNGCSGLTSVTIPNSVESIGQYAFANCSKLLNVYCYAKNVPSTPQSNVFDGSYPQNPTLHVPAGSIESYRTTEPWSDFENIVAISTQINEIRYVLNAETTQATVVAKLSGNYSGSIVIPESVTHENTAYRVTSIGDYAFDGCSGLISVTIPNSVTSIGMDAFEGCTGLTSVTIPNNVTSIGRWAFSGCSGLTSVTIPNSVNSIGLYAFSGCSGLTSVHISDIAAWCNIDFADYSSNPLYYAHHLYLNGVEVKDLVIPNSVESIEAYAFDGCSGLTSVTIGNSVKSIGNQAFKGCSGLSSVTIPNSVTSIGEEAFANCSELHDVYCYAKNVPSTESNAFDGSSIQNPTLHVPAGSVDRYTANAPWSGFKNIVAISTEINGIRYVLNAETTQAAVIAKSSDKYSGDVVIPESVKHENTTYSVTSIGEEAFRDCSDLTSVTIGNSVASIGRSAFEDCSGLTSVTIGNSVASIGNYAFYKCSGLTSVHISDIAAWCNIDFGGEYSNPLSYANLLYLNGVEVKDLEIPNSVTSIGKGVFSNCSGLTSVTIPNSVASIGEKAFLGCSGLTSVTIGNSVESIGSSAFLGCSALPSVTIPNSVKSIGNAAFSGCSDLTSVTIPNSVTSIGHTAFSYCSGLTSVTIGNGVESIEWGTFLDCSGLTTVTIPNSVTSIGLLAFEGCSKLHDVYCYAKNVPNTSSDAFESSSIASATLHVPAGSVDSYKTAPWNGFGTIVAITTEIDGIRYVLNAETTQAAVVSKSDNYSGSIVIPESVVYDGTTYSVTSIGDEAFRSCDDLTSVTIGNSVTSIGDYAFYLCDGLTSVTIGSSVESIGESAFNGCSGLTSVTIGNGVKSIGKWAFLGCSGLTSVTIPNSVTSIGMSAFYGCSGLTSVTIGNSVTSIGYGAFADCSGLTSVTIPNSVTSIGEYAFYKCSGLTSVTIGSGVKSIGDHAFDGCSGLTSVTIGNSVTSIGYGAFADCSGLTSVTIPNSVTSIGDYAFYLCDGLTSVTIGSGVKSIGEAAFYKCSGLTSVTIPNSVESIGNGTFYNCSGLTSVTIGNSVTSIGEWAFEGCSELHDVYCYAEEVPTKSSNAFASSSIASATLHVPAGSIESYKETEPWSGFGKIVGLSNEYSLTVSSVGYATLYLDFNAEIPEGVKAYVAKEVVDNRLKMERVEGVLPANTGVIIRAEEGTYTFVESDETPAVIEKNLLKGTVEDTEITAESNTDYYVLSAPEGVVAMYPALLTDNKFLNNANKAYLPISYGNLGLSDKEVDSSVEQLSRKLVFDFGDETGIDELKGENGNVKTAIFDLSGRRVQKAQKGIFIRDGKVVVK